MKKLSKAAAIAFVLSLAFLLPVGCKTNPTGETSSEENSSSESVPDVDSSVQTPDETPTLPDDTPEPPDDTPQPEPEPEPPAKSYASYIKCTRDGVNIRAGAGTEFPVLGSAEKDTAYVVAGKTGNWYKTYYKNQTAYISASYVTVFEIEKSDDTRVENVLWEAYKTNGVPYVYGAVRLHDGYGNCLKGFTTSKYDCSSLVQYVFYQAAGVVLQTTTRSQVVQGAYVPRDQLSRGDCIYFTNSTRKDYTGIERVGHVAIYLGDNYILHTASDYARIEQISSLRWSYYIETRDFL